MLSWFRARASLVATLAVVSLATVGASAAFPHVDDCHDSACLAMAVEASDDARRLVAPSADDDLQPSHCLVCHWMRSFRLQTEARVVSISASDTGVALQAEVFAKPAAARAVQPPLRAPPAPPLA